MNGSLTELATSYSALPLLDACFKVTLLLGGLLVGVAMMRRIYNLSAARRASILLLGASLVPVVTITSLLHQAPDTSIWQVDAANETSPLLKADPLSATKSSSKAISLGTETLDTELGSNLDIRPKTSVLQAPIEDASVTGAPTPWSSWILGIWIAGMALALTRLAAGVLYLNWRTNSIPTHPVPGRLEDTLRELCQEVGLQRLPQLLVVESRSLMPMTWGIYRHKIVLPSESTTWSRERLSMVLKHEIAHIQRHDCLGSWAMTVLLAPVWFHPLAWLVARRTIDLRERACDDAVTKELQTPDHYARELVTFSRKDRPLLGSLAMARPRRLEARIRAMYVPELGRSDTSKLFRGSAALILVLALLPMLFFTACQALPSAGPASTIEVVQNPDGSTIERAVTPAPDLKKGDDRVRLSQFRLAIDRRILEKNFGDMKDPSPEQQELSKVLIDLFPEGKAKSNVISASKVAEIKKAYWNFYNQILAPFPTGKEYTTTWTQERRKAVTKAYDSMTVTSPIGKRRLEVRGSALRLASGKIQADFEMQQSTAKLRDPSSSKTSTWQAWAKGKSIKSGKQIIENGGALLMGPPRKWDIDLGDTSIFIRALLALTGQKYPYDRNYLILTFLQVEVTRR